jgi:hypothetical protein
MKRRNIMQRRNIMKSMTLRKVVSNAFPLVSLFVIVSLLLLAAIDTQAQTSAADKGKSFATAEEAANELIDAAEKFDVAALREILGPQSYDIIHTGEPARDREVAKEFAALARVKKQISQQPKNSSRAIIMVGEDDWPFSVPLMKTGGRWFFDTQAGRQELLFRRIGFE